LQALASVGKKLLANTDLENPEVMKAVEYFMPTAFIAVNKTCKSFAAAESKFVYTTPKSYLEMLHLYNKMLSRKRALMDKGMLRLQTGIEKLYKAANDVVELEANLRIMLESAEEKRQVSEEIAKNVKREKTVVELENDKAKVEESKVAVIQAVVRLFYLFNTKNGWIKNGVLYSVQVASKQAEASKDLEQAEPALLKAMAALDSLDRRDLGNCKTMAKPPPGVV